MLRGAGYSGLTLVFLVCAAGVCDMHARDAPADSERCAARPGHCTEQCHCMHTTHWSRQPTQHCNLCCLPGVPRLEFSRLCGCETHHPRQVNTLLPHRRLRRILSLWRHRAACMYRVVHLWTPPRSFSRTHWRLWPQELCTSCICRLWTQKLRSVPAARIPCVTRRGCSLSSPSHAL